MDHKRPDQDERAAELLQAAEVNAYEALGSAILLLFLAALTGMGCWAYSTQAAKFDGLAGRSLT
jgi:hypothetical protein